MTFGRAPKAATVRRKLFDHLNPHGVYIAQTVKPISATIYADNGIDIVKRFGGNRACRPVKIGTMWSHRDTITPLLDKNPFVRTRVEARIWLPGAKRQADARRLAGEANYALALAAERAGYGTLESGFVDAGPQFSAPRFQGHLIEAAKAMGIWPAWTDQDLIEFLDQALTFAMQKRINLANRAAMARLMDRMVALETEGKMVFRRKVS